MFTSPTELEAFAGDELLDRKEWTPPASGLHGGPDPSAPPLWVIVDDNCGAAEDWAGATGKRGVGRVCFVRLAPEVGSEPGCLRHLTGVSASTPTPPTGSWTGCCASGWGWDTGDVAARGTRRRVLRRRRHHEHRRGREVRAQHGSVAARRRGLCSCDLRRSGTRPVGGSRHSRCAQAGRGPAVVGAPHPEPAVDAFPHRPRSDRRGRRTGPQGNVPVRDGNALRVDRLLGLRQVRDHHHRGHLAGAHALARDGQRRIPRLEDEVGRHCAGTLSACRGQRQQPRRRDASRRAHARGARGRTRPAWSALRGDELQRPQRLQREADGRPVPGARARSRGHHRRVPGVVPKRDWAPNSSISAGELCGRAGRCTSSSSWPARPSTHTG